MEERLKKQVRINNAKTRVKNIKKNRPNYWDSPGAT
jgi:hypothetical protein